MDRAPGLSVRLKLTLSYAGFLMLAGALLLATVWVFLLRYVPDRALMPVPGSDRAPTSGVFPVRSDLLHAFAPRAAAVLAFLLVFGLVGGWILAGRMLAPLTRITEAARMAGTGSLSHRIRMTGRQDEFRELSDAFDSMLEQLESHVAEQQRFAANASHELRTPLAISRTLLDVARKDPTRAAASSSNACTPSTRGRSTSPRPSCCSAAATEDTSPARASTSPSSPRRPPKRCSPSPNSAGSRSTSPAGRPRPAAPRSCCCEW